MADMAHLIEPVIPALRRCARTFVRGAADADDLVQDTLERAISRWHQRRSNCPVCDERAPHGERTFEQQIVAAVMPWRRQLIWKQLVVQGECTAPAGFLTA
jgi:hypothetical protein